MHHSLTFNWMIFPAGMQLKQTQGDGIHFVQKHHLHSIIRLYELSAH